MEQHVSEQYQSEELEVPTVDAVDQTDEAAGQTDETTDATTDTTDETTDETIGGEPTAAAVDELPPADDVEEPVVEEPVVEEPVAEEPVDEDDEPAAVDPLEAFREELYAKPGDWFVVHTYSG